MSNTKPNVRPGDWVRFYRNGELVIGAVAYLREATTYPYEWQAYTDKGSIACTSILEVRTKRRAK